MWCSACQQDVPALGAASEGTLRCGKCDGSFATAEQGPASIAAAPPSAGGGFRRVDGPLPQPSLPPHAAPESASLEKLLYSPLTEGDWQLEAEVRSAQRLLDSLKARPTYTADSPSTPQAHFPPSASSHGSGVVKKRTRRRQLRDQRQPRFHVAAWTILSLGLAVFTCGAVLLAWSLLARRADLWPIGLPLTLIGQAALILGVVLQLDGLNTSSRQTAEVLSDLDAELKSVREATTLLSTPPKAGRAFQTELN